MLAIPVACVVASAGGHLATRLFAQRTDAFVQSRDHPAIDYTKGSVATHVDELNRKLEQGQTRLAFEDETGYLRSTLAALDIPIESQVAVFAQNSFQAPRINMTNPRVLFFNDAVAVGYVRGGTVIEVAALDPQQGAIFYTLDQTVDVVPAFKRNDGCLACHLSWTTLGVPGFFVMSMQTLPDDKNAYASGFASDHRTSFDSRWGGWFVTGRLGSIRHLGNRPVSTASTVAEVVPEARELASLSERFDTAGYLSAQSDVAALMVLEHQTHAANLITRLGWEARVVGPVKAANDERVRDAAADLVDYLLFVDEPPLPDKIRSLSGFVERFAARGPTDGKGRTLRELDLNRRLMRYPCSYMVYSDAFDALPDSARALVYRRLWRILSGLETGPRYASLSAVDRRSLIEILRDTKKGLPDYFR